MAAAETGKARDAEDNAVPLPRLIRKLNRNRTIRLTESRAQQGQDDTQTALLPIYAVPSGAKIIFRCTRFARWCPTRRR